MGAVSPSPDTISRKGFHLLMITKGLGGHTRLDVASN